MVVLERERVEWKFTRTWPGLEDFIYGTRLDKLGLFSLERRRLWGYLMDVYKIIVDLDGVESQHLFPMGRLSKTRGHRFQVKGRNFKGDLKGKFIPRVVDIWNSMPESRRVRCIH